MTLPIDFSLPLPWKKLIRYQDGSVVSRELIQKKSGTVTLFTFDKGQGLSEHQTPFDALVQVLDGKGEFTINGIPHEVTKGQILLMPAHHPHKVYATEKFVMLLTMIKSKK